MVFTRRDEDHASLGGSPASYSAVVAAPRRLARTNATRILRSLSIQDQFQYRNKITLQKSMARPPGCSFMGSKATSVSALLGKDATQLQDIIIDSGSDITLISHSTYLSLAHPPKPKTGQPVELIQVTGRSTIRHYIELSICILTPEGMVEMTVEPYIVKGMNTSFILGNDFADQYNLSILRKNDQTYLVLGDSGRKCLVENSVGPACLDEGGHTFKAMRIESRRKPTHRSKRTKKRTRADDGPVELAVTVTIPPETVRTVPVKLRFPDGIDYAYVEKLVITKGSQEDCYAPPDSIIHKDRPYLHIANFSKKPIRIKKGQPVGIFHDPRDWLQRWGSDSRTEQEAIAHAGAVKTLINELKPSEPADPEVEAVPEIDGGPKTAAVPDPDVVPKEELLKVVDLPDHLTHEQRAQLEKVIVKNEKAFGLDGRLGHHETRVKINLRPGAKEVSLPPYHASPAKREAIDKQMDSWLSLQVVEPSESSWGSPVLVVYQKGKPRLCVDYRRLNAVTIPDEFPLPRQSDIVQALTGSQWLSTLDALAGFTQMEIDDEDKPKTAFRTHRGLYQFRRMPFGLRNGPGIFQRVMQNVLAPYLWLFTLVYIDDIVIYSKTFSEHVHHVDQVLHAIQKAGLTLSPKKCHFGYQSLLLLGQKVSRLGMSTHQEKVDAITSLEKPRNVGELRTFLGMMVYFSSYMPFYAWLVNPLFALLKKDVPWKWDDLENEAWNLSREALVSAPVRAYAIPGLGYRLYTDACDYGLAGILQQVQPIAVRDLRGTKLHERLAKAHAEGKPVPTLVAEVSKLHPSTIPPASWGETLDDTIVHVERVIAYWSRILKSAEKNYSPTEREALALKESLVKFQAYLEGDKFVAITDHAALTWSKTFQNVNRRLMSWGTVFAAYPEMEIVHRAGRVHSNVDPISRLRRRIPFQDGPTMDDCAELHLSDSSMEKLKEGEEVSTLSFEDRVHHLMERSSRKASLLKKESIPLPLLPDEEEPRTVEVMLSSSSVTLVAMEAEEVSEFVQGYESDPYFAKLISDLGSEEDWSRPKRPEFHSDEQGLLYYSDWAGHSRLCVPSSKRSEILREQHEKLTLGAHSGYHRTYNRIASSYFWPRMSRDIRKFVTTCDVCQKVNVKRHGPLGLLQPIPIPCQPFEVVTMDFIPDLPMSSGYNNVLVIIDKLTKYAIFTPCTTNIDEKETAKIFFDKVYMKYGMPKRVISDRDTRWSRSFWKSLTTLMGSRRALTTSHHPQADGQSEVLNQFLEVGLRTFVGPLRDDWADSLDGFAHSYNSGVQRSTGASPFFLLHGFHPTEPELLMGGRISPIPRVDSAGNLDAEEFAEGVRSVINQAQNALHVAQTHQRTAYNRGRLDEEFEPGDLVLINPHSMALAKDLKGKGRKLLPRYEGPFEVLQKLSPITYRIRIPSSYKIHPVISIAHLQRYHESPEEFGTRDRRPFNRANFETLPEFEVQEILDERWRTVGRKRHKEFLVRFEGFDAEADEWLTETQLTNAPDILHQWTQRADSRPIKNGADETVPSMASSPEEPINDGELELGTFADANHTPQHPVSTIDQGAVRRRVTSSKARDNPELHRLGLGRRK